MWKLDLQLGGLRMPSISTPTFTFRPSMIFIDGGYLRRKVSEIFGHDNINFESLSKGLTQLMHEGLIVPELIRVYYYDAIVKYNDPKFEEQNEYFERIRMTQKYEVKLGRLTKTKDNYRQKGVDVLLAIAMITKAFLNQYDIALLLAGDDDFVDLVKSIKDSTGKRIYGAYFPKEKTDNLAKSFDKRFELSKIFLNPHIIKTEIKSE